MGSKLQKQLYNISSAAPVCFTFAFVWYMQKKTIVIPLTFLIIGMVLIGMMCLSFSYGKRNLAPITIRTSDISPNDGWIIAYIITYMLPFANMVIDEWNLILCGGLAIIIMLCVPFVNTAIPNPILFIRGYHFYQISAENGVSGYVLISKRKLRRKQDLKVINRMYEFLFIDYDGR